MFWRSSFVDALLLDWSGFPGLRCTIAPGMKLIDKIVLGSIWDSVPTLLSPPRRFIVRDRVFLRRPELDVLPLIGLDDCCMRWIKIVMLIR
jgi:hypothetical protein